ncbi:MAG: hypothetical protein INF91_01745, partial [Alphaproteobacteria bacterium]|nr:hypothetical protein [Alphaproteobacteria bacterium]
AATAAAEAITAAEAAAATAAAAEPVTTAKAAAPAPARFERIEPTTAEIGIETPLALVETPTAGPTPAIVKTHVGKRLSCLVVAPDGWYAAVRFS